MPPKSLSHGTLGLKFMNRSSAIIVPPPPGPTTSKTAQPKRVVPAQDDPEWVLPGFSVTHASSSSSSSSSSRIEVEGSYLPFLLGGKEREEKEVEWREKSGKGGRRSFGGLNKDVEKLSLPPAPIIATPSAPEPSSEPTTFNNAPGLSMIDSSAPSTSSSQPPSVSVSVAQPYKPRVAPSIAAGTITLNAPAHEGSGRPGGPASKTGFVRPKGFEDVAPSSSAPGSTSTSKPKGSKKRKSGEVEAPAGGGLLRLGELGLAELVGEEGEGGEEDVKKKHGRKNKDRKRARKEAEMRGGG